MEKVMVKFGSFAQLAPSFGIDYCLPIASFASKLKTQLAFLSRNFK